MQDEDTSEQFTQSRRINSRMLTDKHGERIRIVGNVTSVRLFSLPFKCSTANFVFDDRISLRQIVDDKAVLNATDEGDFVIFNIKVYYNVSLFHLLLIAPFTEHIRTIQNRQLQSRHVLRSRWDCSRRQYHRDRYFNQPRGHARYVLFTSFPYPYPSCSLLSCVRMYTKTKNLWTKSS